MLSNRAPEFPAIEKRMTRGSSPLVFLLRKKTFSLSLVKPRIPQSGRQNSVKKIQGIIGVNHALHQNRTIGVWRGIQITIYSIKDKKTPFSDGLLLLEFFLILVIGHRGYSCQRHHILIAQAAAKITAIL